MTKHLLIALLVSLPVVYAQPAVAPSPDRPGVQKGQDFGDYNITNSFEMGYRFNTVSGDESLYRSQANYRSGLSLLDSRFAMNSKDGHGGLFDFLSLNNQGFGSDPYSTSSLRIEKNERFRYDLNWRRSEYFNPFLINGGSQNLADTSRLMQDHELRIRGTRWLNFNLGYSRNTETGPVVSSYELFIGGLSRSVLPIDRNVHREWNGYRTGADIDFLGFRLSLSHRWDFYKDDTRPAVLLPGQSYPLTNTSVANTYRRDEPMHGRTPAWIGNLTTKHTHWAMNARAAYSKGDQDFIYDESAIGAATSGAQATVSTLMIGSGRRPYMTTDLSFSIVPTTKLTIVSTSSAMSNRIDGTGQMLQLSTAAATQNLFWFSRLATGRVGTSLDVNYRLTNWLALNAGWTYMDRWTDSILTRAGTRASNSTGALVNHVNAGTFGFRLKPIKPVTINLESTIGRDNSAFTPVGLSDYHTIRGRVEYKTKNWRVAGAYRQLYNLNAPVAFSYYKSHSRDTSGSASFKIASKLWVDTSYSKLHMDTLDALNVELPVGNAIQNVRGYYSEYISNIHAGSFSTRTLIGDRATLYLGYSITRDAGDGRSIQNMGLQNVASAYLAGLQTFPMTYQAPLVRATVKLTPKMSFNAGWEMYRYGQEFAYFNIQPNYRANTGYTSVSWAF